MDADELRDAIVAMTENVSGDGSGDGLSFKSLVQMVTPSGECTNCYEGPIRRALIKLLDHGDILLTTMGT